MSVDLIGDELEFEDDDRGQFVGCLALAVLLVISLTLGTILGAWLA